MKTGASSSGISSCCRKEHKTAKGLSWCYEVDYNKNAIINDPKEKPIICIDTKERYESIVAASKKLKIPSTTLHTAIKFHTPTRGMFFCYEKELNNWKPAVNKAKKPVICIETGVAFESARDAQRKTGVTFGNIFNAIKSGGTAGGLKI